VKYASAASILGRIGTVLAVVLKPAGFGFWWAAAALLAGVVAKETVVGTMATIHGVGAEGLVPVVQHHFTPLSAYAFMVMALSYLPCAASFAAIRRELGWRWAFLAAGYTLVLGWLVAVAVYQVGRLLM